jgi:hypothetical protein
VSYYSRFDHPVRLSCDEVARLDAWLGRGTRTYGTNNILRPKLWTYN